MWTGEFSSLCSQVDWNLSLSRTDCLWGSLRQLLSAFNFLCVSEEMPHEQQRPRKCLEVAFSQKNPQGALSESWMFILSPHFRLSDTCPLAELRETCSSHFTAGQQVSELIFALLLLCNPSRLPHAELLGRGAGSWLQARKLKQTSSEKHLAGAHLKLLYFSFFLLPFLYFNLCKEDLDKYTTVAAAPCTLAKEMHNLLPPFIAEFSSMLPLLDDRNFGFTHVLEAAASVGPGSLPQAA